MNATAPVLASLRDPAEVLAALPYLLGFHPRDSLVVAAIQPGAPPTLGLVLRADLPPPGGEHALVEQLRAPLLARGGCAVLVAVIGGPGRPPQPPPAVVGLLRAALADRGVTVVHALWARSTAPGAPWACLDRPEHAGLLPDATGSPIAAATAVAGLVTYADRAELHRLVAPDDDAALQRRAELLDAAVEAAELDRSPAAVRRNVRLVRDAVLAAGDGRLPTGDHELVRLAVALCDQLVRGCSIGLCLGETAAAAERLWLALVRATPPPEVAEPAALAALSAYLRGDGALAGMALDRALQAWPGHNLASLVDQVVRAAIPPDVLRQVVVDAHRDAELDLADEAEAG